MNTADGESGDLRPLPPSRPPSRPPRTPSAGKGTPTTTPAHTKCAAYAEPPIDSWHTYAKYTACAEPSRQDWRHAASRQDWSLGGTHADSTPAHAKQPCAADNAEPSIDSKHAHAKCATYAEPSRQDRRHAADSTPAIGEPSQMPRMPSRPCATDAEPPIDSWHTHSKCAACAEPSRQDRRHAADSTPAIGEPSQIRGPT